MSATLMWMSLNRSVLVLGMKYIEAMEKVEGMPCSSVINGTEMGFDPVIAEAYQVADHWRAAPPAIPSGRATLRLQRLLWLSLFAYLQTSTVRWLLHTSLICK